MSCFLSFWDMSKNILGCQLYKMNRKEYLRYYQINDYLWLIFWLVISFVHFIRLINQTIQLDSTLTNNIMRMPNEPKMRTKFAYAYCSLPIPNTRNPEQFLFVWMCDRKRIGIRHSTNRAPAVSTMWRSHEQKNLFK